MAQLKDLLVNGATRLIGDVFTNKIQITAISAPTASNGTTYGPGTSGQVLKSNGTSVYWGTDSNSVTGVKGNSESSYRTGNVNITAANIGLGNVENTKLSTWAGSANITTIGTLSSGTVPWARLSGVPAGASKEGTVTSITPGNGLLNGTGTSAITSSGTLNLNYGTSATAIGTASAGSANTVSRSDHVHSISLATGDSNGQVKIAGTNVSVKGLGSNAYTSTAYLPLAGGKMTGPLSWADGTALPSSNGLQYILGITAFASGGQTQWQAASSVAVGSATTATTATKATQDGSGNNIVNTYLTKTTGVTNVAWDSTNKKLTKTINGTTSDIVTISTIKTALSLAKGDVGLGNVENTKLSTWAGSANITTIGTLSSGTVPWARLSNVPAGATKEGTVTKVIAGTGLSIGSTSGGNFTTSGTINHTNSITAQTTQAIYPIKIDAQGHISAYGSAVTIPNPVQVVRLI